jgi:hypothetical protein
MHDYASTWQHVQDTLHNGSPDWRQPASSLASCTFRDIQGGASSLRFSAHRLAYKCAAAREDRLNAFKQGLDEGGYNEGRSVAFE